jgi:hypothetical protein
VLEQKKQNDKYVCNWCGKVYDIRDATLAKGNHFMCSMQCVLEYEDANGGK